MVIAADSRTQKKQYKNKTTRIWDQYNVLIESLNFFVSDELIQIHLQMQGFYKKNGYLLKLS